jgi:altronate hydrolase
VHTHNLAFADFARAHEPGAGAPDTQYVASPATFDGIVRADAWRRGLIATRNYIGVLTSVNCSATAARAIADAFRRDIHPEVLAPYPQVDGVVALTHGMGCATDSEGEELAVLRRTLGGYARHPNFAAGPRGGLGCETTRSRASSPRKACRKAPTSSPSTSRTAAAPPDGGPGVE